MALITRQKVQWLSIAALLWANKQPMKQQHPASPFHLSTTMFNWAKVTPSAVGRALALQKRPLVYGGGSAGIMGVVSGAVLEHGGKVTGILPYAMVKSGGERVKVDGEDVRAVDPNEKGREAVSGCSRYLP
jgi:hypothetical protein